MISPKKRQQVLELIKNGKTHREIAKMIGIGVGTVSKIRNLPMSAFGTEPMKNRRVLVIGDLHAPFIRPDYLEFCKSVYKEYKCDTVVFTGDVLDNHFSSFHETIPDGLGAGDELDAAIEQLKEWHDSFPNAFVCIGNHDRMASRKAVASGVSQRWIKDYSDVIECPTWRFAESFTIDGVCYEHGEGMSVEKKMLCNRRSYVCGHKHSELYVKFSVSEHDRLFAMQIGWGGDQDSYSMEYAKNFAKGVVSCGVVLKNGTMPIAIPMPLMDKEK